MIPFTRSYPLIAFAFRQLPLLFAFCFHATPSPSKKLTPPSQPPPPTWLTAALSALSPSYPQDRFEGMMRYSAVDATTEMPCAAPPQGESREGVKWMYLPRIRCMDCPGKLYTPGGPGPAGAGSEMSVQNFEVHLKNRIHREKVEARVRAEQGQ